MAIKASFEPATGILTGVGDDLDNMITVNRDAAGALLINGGSVSILGGDATVANTTGIQLSGLAGNDTIMLDESTGVLPAARLDGGAGNDLLVSGSDNDQLFGGSGDDVLLGKGGNDQLFGGSGNDVLTGGVGSDQVFGDSGDDRMIWNPGDGSDLFEGDSGIDTAEINGGNGAEMFSIAANGARVSFERVVPAPFTLDIGTTENLVLNANGGGDNIMVSDLTGTAVKQVTIDLGAGDGQADVVSVDATAGNDLISIASSGASVAVTGLSAQVTISGAEAANDLLIVAGLGGNDTVDASALNAGQIHLTIDGGDGNDTIIGSRGADVLLGGDGNDLLTGGVGNDQVFGGDGNDRMVWNQGDGSDLFEGGAGTDTAEINGGNGSETFAITANGARVRFDRINPAPFSLDIGATENLVLNAGGGDDVITASNGLTTLINLTIDGGAGNDTVIGATAMIC